MGSTKSQLQTVTAVSETNQSDVLPFTLIPEHKVSIEWLRDLFKRAFVTCEIDNDGDLYITDGLEFPIWITLLEDQRLIRLFTFLRRDPEEHGPITEAGVNYLNATVLVPAFYIQKGEPDRLHAAYVLSYAHGVLDVHVVGAARRFAGASLYGAQKLHDFVIH